MMMQLRHSTRICFKRHIFLKLKSKPRPNPRYLSSIIPNKKPTKSSQTENQTENQTDNQTDNQTLPLHEVPPTQTGFQKFCKYYNGIGFGIGGMYLGFYVPAYIMTYGAMSIGFFSNDFNNFLGLLSLVGPVCMITVPPGIYFGWKYGKLCGDYALPVSTFAYLCLLSS